MSAAFSRRSDSINLGSVLLVSQARVRVPVSPHFVGAPFSSIPLADTVDRDALAASTHGMAVQGVDHSARHGARGTPAAHDDDHVSDTLEDVLAALKVGGRGRVAEEIVYGTRRRRGAPPD